MGDRRFATSLRKRRNNAAAKALRYRTDPEWRLQRINRARRQLGLPLRASLDDVRMRVPMEIER